MGIYYATNTLGGRYNKKPGKIIMYIEIEEKLLHQQIAHLEIMFLNDPIKWQLGYRQFFFFICPIHATYLFLRINKVMKMNTPIF